MFSPLYDGDEQDLSPDVQACLEEYAKILLDDLLPRVRVHHRSGCLNKKYVEASRKIEMAQQTIDRLGGRVAAEVRTNPMKKKELEAAEKQKEDCEKRIEILERLSNFGSKNIGSVDEENRLKETQKRLAAGAAHADRSASPRGEGLLGAPEGSVASSGVVSASKGAGAPSSVAGSSKAPGEGKSLGAESVLPGGKEKPKNATFSGDPTQMNRAWAKIMAKEPISLHTVRKAIVESTAQFLPARVEGDLFEKLKQLNATPIRAGDGEV